MNLMQPASLPVPQEPSELPQCSRLSGPGLSPQAMREAALQACQLLKVLSNPDRLLLLCQLSVGEFRVGELEALVGVQQPTLSQQLGVLREEKLVSTRREGKAIYYQMANPQALAIMQVLYEQFCRGSSESVSKAQGLEGLPPPQL